MCLPVPDDGAISREHVYGNLSIRSWSPGQWGVSAERSECDARRRNGKAGIYTAGHVAVFVLNRPSGLSQGFETFRETTDAVPEGDANVPISRRASNELRADVVADSAIQWLGDNAKKRFFFFVHFFDAHAPYEPPEPFLSRYDGRGPVVEGVKVGRYLGEIAYIDQQIGRVLDELKRLDLDKNTLVILTGDHGEAFGEHGVMGHSYFLYDTTMHVPLIMRLPDRIKPGLKVSRQVRLIDIAPTILDLAHLDKMPSAQGKSLVSYLDDPSDDLGLSAYIETLAPYLDYRFSPLSGLRSDRWKYILAPHSELYDLVADPQEKHNLFDAQPKIAEEMFAQLSDMIETQTPSGAGDSGAPSDEMVKRLQGLGYVGSSPPTDLEKKLNPLEPHGADPKERIEEMKLGASAARAAMDKRFDYAESLYRRILVKDPDHVLFLSRMGVALVRQNKTSDAIVTYEKIAKLDPDNVDAHEKLAGLFVRQRDLDGATRHMSEVARLRPGEPQILLELGRMLGATGKLDAAAEVLNRALRLDEGNTEVCLMLAKIASFKEDYVTAAQLLEQSIKHDKDQVAAIEQLVWLRSTCPDASIRNAQQALELADHLRDLTKENSPRLLVLESTALAEAGRFDEAIKTAGEAEKLASQSAANSLEAKFGPLAAAIGAACRDGRSYQSARPLYASLTDLPAK